MKEVMGTKILTNRITYKALNFNFENKKAKAKI
jgi:hypothetical protein